MRFTLRARPELWIFIVLIAMTLSVAWVVLSPGLHGEFLFDDFANLPALGDLGPVNTWHAFWRYITSGNADPTGRPLALLTFLLDARNWPAAPYPFKRTNLLIHLINGALLGGFLWMLGVERARALRTGRDQTVRVAVAAVLGAAFWLLHPLFVSTTLYVVQREAMLPGTATLLGLMLWLTGRSSLWQGRVFRGVAQISLGLGLCTLLAVLCKANGILLPALALVIEYIFLRSVEDGALTKPNPAAPGVHRIYVALLLALAWLPTALVACYLSYLGWRGLTYGISDLRPWTLGQRLMTEPGILLDYLKLLWIPRPFTAGLFNDQIRPATSFLAPSTWLSIGAIATLIAWSIAKRKSFPGIAVAILFFFTAQSIESTTIPLELYFEHRNYVPAMLLFWPLAWWLCGLTQNTSDSYAQPSRWHKHDVVKGLMVGVLLTGLASMTYVRASLWGNAVDQAILWAKLNPSSPRAQASAAQTEASQGRPDLAAERLRKALQESPAEIQLALNLFATECQMGAVTDNAWNTSLLALQNTRDPGTLLAGWFERAIDQSGSPSCPQVDLKHIELLLIAAQSNVGMTQKAGRAQDILFLRGRIELVRGAPDAALAYFNQALDQQVRETVAFRQAALLGSYGYPDQGLKHLAYFSKAQGLQVRQAYGMPRIHEWVLDRQGFWTNELERLRLTLQVDAKAASDGEK